MRTPQEIINYYEVHTANDFLGFLGDVLLGQLPFEDAKPYLKDEATEEDWGKPIPDRETLLAAVADYMEFAWEKCVGHRGISATRSVQKMQAYMFLLGEDELEAVTQDESRYSQYGAPILWEICKKLGWPVAEGPEAERMARGLPCIDGCEMGCEE